MNQQLIFLLTGIAGFIFHSLLKLKSLNDDSMAANLTFNIYRDYIKKDIYGLIAAFFSPFIWLLLFGEIAAQYPALEKFAITSFFVFGALGSYILQLILGRAKKEIRNVVKSNNSDPLEKTN